MKLPNSKKKAMEVILTYFNSAYINSSRYSDNLYKKFVLVFERNIKYKATVSSFGTVFKNNKWSDFKTQNIKKIFIKDKVLLLSSILGFLTIMLILLNATSNIFWPFMAYLDYICLFLGSYFLHTKAYLYRNVNGRGGDNFFKNTLDSTKLEKNLNKSNPISKELIIPAYTKTFQHKGPILHFASQATNNINLVNSTPNDFNFNNLWHKLHMLNQLKNFKTKVWFLVLADDTYNEKQHSFTVSEKNHLLETPDYLLNSKNVLRNRIHTDPLLHLTPANLNISSSLTLAKQDRWLLKNSILGNNLIESSHRFTESKLLINSSPLNVNTSTNVWASSSLSKLSKMGAYNFGNFLANSQNTPKSNTTLNEINLNKAELNFFENSRFFVTKRFFFVNQIKNNAWSVNLDYKQSKPIVGAEVVDTSITLHNWNELNKKRYDSNFKEISHSINLLKAKKFESEVSKALINNKQLDFAPLTLSTDNLNFIHNTLAQGSEKSSLVVKNTLYSSNNDIKYSRKFIQTSKKSVHR